MARQDLEDAEIAFDHARYPSAVFHSQQAAEKACKALLTIFGIEAGKTHFPSFEIKTRLLRGRYELSEEQVRY